MSFSEALNIAFERSNQLQTYWSFYATAVLALLAFFGSAKAETRSPLLAFLLTLAFAGLSLANLEALLDVSRQRIALQAILISLAGNDSARVSLVQAITPSTLSAVRGFHIVFDIFTVTAIWVLTLRRNAVVATVVKPAMGRTEESAGTSS